MEIPMEQPFMKLQQQVPVDVQQIQIVQHKLLILVQLQMAFAIKLNLKKNDIKFLFHINFKSNNEDNTLLT